MTQAPNFKRTKYACYTAYFTMSSVFCVPSLLFVTLRDTYGISYTLLGTLVLTCFVVQLSVDLLFSFFSKHFNTRIIVKVMPLVTSLGLALYALIPTLLPQLAYPGLLLGTVVFSLSAGLSEALLSPTIAALPSDNPQRDMSILHSLYGFGVLTMVTVSTLFLRLFGTENWWLLLLILSLLPLIAAFMFAISPMPDMEGHVGGASAEGSKHRWVGLALCVACIFLGSCTEVTMGNWLSSYMEQAVGVQKVTGDILGVAMYALILGLTRVWYARFGKRIAPVLAGGLVGAMLCYLVAGLAPGTILPFGACLLMGLFTSMLWPGALIFMEERLPAAGVTAYALMAAGGDLGGAVGPQLLGAVVDGVSSTHTALELGQRLGMTAEQLGLRVGMLVTALFPVLGLILLGLAIRHFRKHRTQA